MKILYVDQFAKTAGKDSLELCSIINEFPNVEIIAYMSSDIVFDETKYSFPIEKGFLGAFTGNIIHKTLCYLKGVRELISYVNKNKIDVIHLQWFSIPWIERFFIKKLKKHSKVVITVHDIVPFDLRPFEKLSLKSIYKKADHLFVHTEKAKNDFLEFYGIKNKISVITQAFRNKSKYFEISKETARQHFGIPQRSIVFLFYGTIRKSKGLDFLIDVMKHAYTINNSVFLLVAGAFHSVDEKYYRALASSLSNDNALVKFGYVPFEEEPYYFSAADVLCLPYKELTQSGVAQLGLMYDLPIIATDVGAMAEVVKNGENGFLCNVGSSDEFVNAVLELAKDKDLRDKYGRNSGIIANNEFSLQKKASLIVQGYKEL